MPKPSNSMLRALVCTLSLVLASTSAAYTETLGIQGLVLDPSGTPMSGATVTLTSGDQSREKSLQTGEDGRFRFGELSQGSYRVTASSRGYRAADRPVFADRLPWARSPGGRDFVWRPEWRSERRGSHYRGRGRAKTDG